MEPKRVGVIVIVALIVLALLGAGVQGVMHQQWMQGFAVGQMAATAGDGQTNAALMPYIYAANQRGGPGHFFGLFFAITFFAIVMHGIARRHAWRRYAMQNPAMWGQEAGAQAQMPPWMHHGRRNSAPGGWGHGGWGHGGWGHGGFRCGVPDAPVAQAAAADVDPGRQPSAPPPATGERQGPQPPVDL